MSTLSAGRNEGKCLFNEHYSEGSSWEAYKVLDRLYVGGNEESVVENGRDYAVEYEFGEWCMCEWLYWRLPFYCHLLKYSLFVVSLGCMSSVTGLFETQLADGIMGLSR